MSNTLENIDDAIAYLESPEYLRMVALQQDEDSSSLLGRPGTVVTAEPAVRTPPGRAPDSYVQHLRTRDSHTLFSPLLESRTPFQTRGRLLSTTYPAGVGQLRFKYEAAASLFRADEPYIDYAVYSYSTPIVWHVTSDGYSEWVFPLVKYSRTTSRHQNKIKAALEDCGASIRYLGRS